MALLVSARFTVIQQAIAFATLSAVLAAAVGHEDFTPRPKPDGEVTAKALDLSGSGSRTRRSKWAVADGLAELHLGMGPSVGPGTNALFAWMRAEGALEDRFFDWDWSSIHARIRAGEVSEADFEAARDNVARFLETGGSPNSSAWPCGTACGSPRSRPSRTCSPRRRPQRAGSSPR